MPKSFSASIVFDFTQPPLSGWWPCLNVKVTSQNSPQLLVSNKYDLADSTGSHPTSIELLFACIQGAHFVFLQVHYRVALAQLRVALELVLIGDLAATSSENRRKNSSSPEKRPPGEWAYARKNLSGICARTKASGCLRTEVVGDT